MHNVLFASSPFPFLWLAPSLCAPTHLMGLSTYFKNLLLTRRQSPSTKHEYVSQEGETGSVIPLIRESHLLAQVLSIPRPRDSSAMCCCSWQHRTTWRRAARPQGPTPTLPGAPWPGPGILGVAGWWHSTGTVKGMRAAWGVTGLFSRGTASSEHHPKAHPLAVRADAATIKSRSPPACRRVASPRTTGTWAAEQAPEAQDR